MVRRGPLAVAMAFGVIVASGCGASTDPFALGGAVSAGPTSGLWGDGSAGPTGMNIGCVRGRRLVVLITVQNRTKRTITLLGGGGAQPFRDVIDRAAVQVRLAPPVPQGVAGGDSGIRAWSARDSAPVRIPAGRSAWVQSNFIMRDCGSLGVNQTVALNDHITLTYSAGDRRRTQRMAVAGARIILTRGPPRPKLPTKKIG